MKRFIFVLTFACTIAYTGANALEVAENSINQYHSKLEFIQ